MDNNMMFLIAWIIAMVVFIIAEVATTALVSIWFIAGAFIAAILNILNFSVLVQTIVFFVVSIVSLVLFLPFIKKHKKSKPEMNRDIDSYLDEHVILTKAFIKNIQDGECVLGTNHWDVVSLDEDIEKGAEAIVVNVSGNKLIVKKL